MFLPVVLPADARATSVSGLKDLVSYIYTEPSNGINYLSTLTWMLEASVWANCLFDLPLTVW